MLPDAEPPVSADAAQADTTGVDGLVASTAAQVADETAQESNNDPLPEKPLAQADAAADATQLESDDTARQM